MSRLHLPFCGSPDHGISRRTFLSVGGIAGASAFAANMRVLDLLENKSLAGELKRQQIAQAGGTQIIVDRATADIFPENWRSPKVNAKAELLEPEEQARCKEIVDKVLSKYPLAVLNRNLQKVYVLGRLEFSGIAAAGSNLGGVVYVVGRKYSAAQIEDLFHAEFSSILLRNFPKDLDQMAWHQANPPSFKYLGNGVQAVKEKKASVRSSEAAHEEGFMHDYAKASLEEDFNTIASRLLMGDPVLWKAIEKHPRLKAKAELTMAFYQKLDASFTREFFASLRKN